MLVRRHRLTGYVDRVARRCQLAHTFRQEVWSRQTGFTFEVNEGVGHSFTNTGADAWGGSR